jgi:tRNA modification GTPase
MEDDTIVAISTPPGRGALGLVRISGPASHSILGSLSPHKTTWIDRRATHAKLRTPTGDVVDDVVITYFQGPRSYSGEDMAEISCHGSPLILDRIVGAALASGARPARPGEFTLRAFLNGRIDLTQAEAVVDLVEARTDAGLGLALRQLEGELSKRVETLRSDLLDLLAHITAIVDFSEEDIPPMAGEDVKSKLDHILAGIDALLRGARQGQVLQHGVSLAIIGAPNAGKSSMLNALLRRDRAIVTPIAGTTRDTLEEELNLDGVLFRVVDTAGITETDDPVEVIGIQRSRAAVEDADIVLVVIDRSRRLTDEDSGVLMLAQNPNGHQAAVALNKSDLPPAVEPADLTRLLPGAAVVETCALDSEGLGGLRELLPRLALAGPVPDGFVVSNQRHIQSLQLAGEAVGRAISAQHEHIPLDLMGLDVRAAAESLGQILGFGIGDELLDRVFSRFCIGK